MDGPPPKLSLVKSPRKGLEEPKVDPEEHKALDFFIDHWEKLLLVAVLACAAHSCCEEDQEEPSLEAPRSLRDDSTFARLAPQPEFQE